MNNSLFAGNLFMQLSHSLVRYFRYILNMELQLLQSNISVEPNDIDLLFVLNEPPVLEKCCQWMFNNKVHPDKFRIMGYDDNNDIKLLDINTLKKQFENNFRIKKGIDRIKTPFFRDQISLFFKGHGELSLLQCLTYVWYNLNNYLNLVKIGDYTTEGLHQNFLMPGIQNWNEFIHRFNKYAPILYVWGWATETVTINRLIKNISIDLLKIDTSNPFVIFELESMALINEIVIILEKLAQQQQD